MNMWYKSSVFAKTNNLVQGSCNGLTLVRYHLDTFRGVLFAVTNPLSKQYYELPLVNKTVWMFGSLAAGIGFDESTNTFKTVCVMYKRQHNINLRPTQLCTLVYSLGMRSWREIAHNPAYLISGEGVFAHGRLHWLGDQYWPADYAERKIVWFDVKMEVFGLTDPPKQNLSGYKMQDRVVDLKGELGYAFFKPGLVGVKLWILNKEEWVLHCCIRLHYAMHNVVISGCLNKNGDILLTAVGHIGKRRRLFVYTLKTGDLQAVNLDDQYKSDIRMYQSSLSSICAASISAYSVRNRSMRKIIDSIAFSPYLFLVIVFVCLYWEFA
ncbi:putative F-box protein At1g55070 [Bidens hawaiensis]|uniref:putative F-box protein At1g55070 n=1 Tax=Bidens hawaiensis TaxID=980011 RepID=UPI004049989E